MNLVKKIIEDNIILVEENSARNLFKNKNIIIYGSGEGYIALQRTTLKKLNIKPVLIIDKQFSDNDSLDGIQCCNINIFTKNLELFNDYIIVVTIGNVSVAEDIKLTLKGIGCSDVVWAPDLYEYSLHHQNKKIDNEGVDFFKNQSDCIDEVYKSLTDEKSRVVFSSLLTRYITGKPAPIPSDTFDEQYIAADILPIMKNMNYVCCGAFDGDSIKKVVGVYGKLNSVYSFEPDPHNYSKLCKYISQNINLISNSIVNVPCGVYSETKIIKFSGGNSLSSTIDENGDDTIQVVSLDDAISGSNITYITMDVEGAELEALLGAENILKQQTPNLAISIYHYPEHLWEIARYLLSLNLEYKFYIRNYSGFTYESILYAVK